MVSAIFLFCSLICICAYSCLQIIIQPQSASTGGSQLQLVGGQLVQMQNGQTVIYQTMPQTETMAQTQQHPQQIQTIQIQNASMFYAFK